MYFFCGERGAVRYRFKGKYEAYNFQTHEVRKASLRRERVPAVWEEARNLMYRTYNSTNRRSLGTSRRA